MNPLPCCAIVFSFAFSPVDTVQCEQIFSFGNFSNALALDISPAGLVYVVDTGSNKVEVFTSEGDSVREVGGYGWGELEFDRPVDVYVGSGLNIYVADYGNHRVERFDKDLNFLSTFYTRESEDIGKRFGYPKSVSLSRLGDLFILDGENTRVLKINTASVMERTFGGVDAGKGRLRNPRQLNVTTKDLVCVLDEARIVLFDNFGNYLRTIGTGLLKNPTGMTIVNDTVCVVDNREILLFDTAGRLLSVLQPEDSDKGEGEVRFTDLAVYRQHLYVLTEHSVKVFRRNKETP